MALTPGTMLGPYTIGAPLGAGGMGEVYRARDSRLGREIALKVIPESFAQDPERPARFVREARTVAALNHPGIVTIHSIEEFRGTRVLTMELVEGQSLDRVIVGGGLPVDRLLALTRALADALAAAHGRGVIHRDLKPANVMVTPQDRIKVLDFGLARGPAALAGADGEPPSELPTLTGLPLSMPGVVMGTLSYMAPEQLRGEPLDERADLFALGIILYEMASGRHPFAGKSVVDVTSAILRDTPVPIGDARPDLPAAFADVVATCLMKAREQRTCTAQAAHDRIEEALRGRGIERRPSWRGGAGGNRPREQRRGAQTPAARATFPVTLHRGGHEDCEPAPARRDGARRAQRPAWVELSRASSREAFLGWAPLAECVDRARDAAERALAIEPDLAEAHAELGRIRTNFDWDWTGADAALRRALALGPGIALTHQLAAALAFALGRLDEAIEHCRRATEQDALNVAAHHTLGAVLRAADRLQEGEAALRTVLELNPQKFGVQADLALTLAAQGRAREALDMAASARTRRCPTGLSHSFTATSGSDRRRMRRSQGCSSSPRTVPTRSRRCTRPVEISSEHSSGWSSHSNSVMAASHRRT